MMCDDVVVLIHTIKILMQFVIPYILMAFIDLFVIVRLRKLKIGLDHNSKSSRFSRNTILIDFIYLIFNFPPIISNALSIHILISKHTDISNIFLYMKLIPMFNTIFPYIYPSILFLVFLTFNRIFRSEFFAIAINCFNAIKTKLF